MTSTTTVPGSDLQRSPAGFGTAGVPDDGAVPDATLGAGVDLHRPPAERVIATWQDGTLTSAARIEGGTGTLEQAHFGLYAPPDLLAGTVFNDDLTIWHLDP